MQILDHLEALVAQATERTWKPCNGGIRTTWLSPDRYRKDGKPYKNAKMTPYYIVMSVTSMFGKEPTERQLTDWHLICAAVNALPELIAVARAAEDARGYHLYTPELDDALRALAAKGAPGTGDPRQGGEE